MIIFNPQPRATHLGKQQSNALLKHNAKLLIRKNQGHDTNLVMLMQFDNVWHTLCIRARMPWNLFLIKRPLMNLCSAKPWLCRICERLALVNLILQKLRNNELYKRLGIRNFWDSIRNFFQKFRDWKNIPFLYIKSVYRLFVYPFSWGS